MARLNDTHIHSRTVLSVKAEVSFNHYLRYEVADQFAAIALTQVLDPNSVAYAEMVPHNSNVKHCLMFIQFFDVLENVTF